MSGIIASAAGCHVSNRQIDTTFGAHEPWELGVFGGMVRGYVYVHLL